MVIVGSGVLQRPDADAIHAATCSIANSVARAVEQGWRTLNVLHRVCVCVCVCMSVIRIIQTNNADSTGHIDSCLLFIWLQVASQVGALDIGYRPGLKPEDLKSAKLIYLLAAVSPWNM